MRVISTEVFFRGLARRLIIYLQSLSTIIYFHFCRKKRNNFWNYPNLL